MPHAPLLLKAVAGESDPCCASRDAACQLLAENSGSTFVVISPHADRTGVYASSSGDLSGFGARHMSVSARTYQGTSELAGGWGQPLLEDPLDHGSLLPIAIAPPGSTFVCCGIAESAAGESAVELGRSLAQAVLSVGWAGNVTFLASAHSAASLTPRAPLTERPEGAQFDAELLRLLTSDPAGLARADAIASELWSQGGSCSQASLAALGEMARLCDVHSFEVLSHESPVGVGMLVARGRV